MKQGKHIYVSGRVQGVWYRVFVLRVARELQITGWVKNMDDGRVGIAVYGEEDRIKKFVAKLHRGPSGAVVELVECKDIP